MIFKHNGIKSTVAYKANGEMFETIVDARAALALEALKKHTYTKQEEFDEDLFLKKYPRIMDEFCLIDTAGVD